MSDSEELVRKERRQRLIDRLNENEKLLGPSSPARGDQMSEEQLETEIEKERQRNFSRQGLPYTGIGGRFIHPSAWRNCPKRGRSDGQSVALAGVRRQKGPKRTVSVDRRATL